ncbi:hypothetical protein [Lentzea cavernae]|uniref:hypothetical protein n=1 Tax=Lentzea cavernae TaxID=2020703 RepID=UPI001748430A|nr:hypothetical protein [Lentzea cavernae]
MSAGASVERLAGWSACGPVAFVDAEYFGGNGFQRAQVWDAGRGVLGPLVREEGDRCRTSPPSPSRSGGSVS